MKVASLAETTMRWLHARETHAVNRLKRELNCLNLPLGCRGTKLLEKRGLMELSLEMKAIKSPMTSRSLNCLQ